MLPLHVQTWTIGHGLQGKVHNSQLKPFVKDISLLTRIQAFLFPQGLDTFMTDHQIQINA